MDVVDVEFVRNRAPEGTPILTGPGHLLCDEEHGVVFSGTVFDLSSWWMQPLVMAAVFGVSIPLLVAADHFRAEPKLALSVWGAGVVGLLVVDWVRRRFGRPYQLALPAGVGASVVPLPSRRKALVTLVLDSLVVGVPKRPMSVSFHVDKAHLGAVLGALRGR